MFKRIVIALVLSLVASLTVTACSATDNRNLSGQAAQEALNTVVKNSVKKMTTEGGAETLAVGQTTYAIIYDPTAPEGKQVVTANLTDESPATFDSLETVSLLALERLLTTPLLEDAEVTLTKNIFTIQGKDFLVEIFVTDDLVYKSNIWSSTSGSQDPQIVVIKYGISDESRTLFNSAVETAPAQ